MEAFFLKHPNESFNIEALARVFSESGKATVQTTLSQLAKRNGIQGAVVIKDSWKKAHWKLSPSYKTLEQIRSVVEVHAKENQRVFQSEEPFDPAKPVITNGDHPALPTKRMFFSSIIERMQKSDLFGAADVELLKKEAPHLLDPGK